MSARRRVRRPNGEPRPYLDATKGRWYVGFELPGEGGKRVRRKVSGATEEEARDRALQARAKLARGLDLPAAGMRAGEFLDWWLADIVPGTVSEGSLRTYSDLVRLYVKPNVGSVRLRDLRPAHVSRMMSTMAKADKAPATQNQARKILSRALRRAEQEGLVERNVAAVVDGPKLERQERRALELDQAKQLLASIGTHPMAPAIMAGLMLGLRRGELLGLSWSDVDLDADEPRLTVRHQLQRYTGRGLVLVPLKTAKSRRTLRLPAELAASLREHRRKQIEARLLLGPMWGNDADLVFTTPMGTPVDPRNFLRVVSSVAEAAGLGSWTVHELRHSAGSLLFALGVPMRTISEVLGHSSERVTSDVYVHLTESQSGDAVEVLGAALRTG